MTGNVDVDNVYCYPFLSPCTLSRLLRLYDKHTESTLSSIVVEVKCWDVNPDDNACRVAQAFAKAAAET